MFEAKIANYSNILMKIHNQTFDVMVELKILCCCPRLTSLFAMQVNV